MNVVPSQDQVDVFLNQDGDIVILQKSFERGDDTAVVIAPQYAGALAKAIRNAVKDAANG